MKYHGFFSTNLHVGIIHCAAHNNITQDVFEIGCCQVIYLYRSSEFNILHMRKKFHTNIKPSIGLKQNDSPSIVRSKTILSLSFFIFVTYHLLFNSMLCNWVSEVTLTSGGENRLLNYHTALFHNKSTFAHLSMAENIIVQKHVHHYPLPLYYLMRSKLRKI